MDFWQVGQIYTEEGTITAKFVKLEKGHYDCNIWHRANLKGRGHYDHKILADGTNLKGREDIITAKFINKTCREGGYYDCHIWHRANLKWKGHFDCKICQQRRGIFKFKGERGHYSCKIWRRDIMSAKLVKPEKGDIIPPKFSVMANLKGRDIKTANFWQIGPVCTGEETITAKFVKPGKGHYDCNIWHRQI